jgi:hypothetical protein
MFRDHREPVDDPLPFSLNTAERLMEIAAHFKSLDPKSALAQSLPNTWTSLYELTSLPMEQITVLVDSRRLHADLTREQVKRLVFVRIIEAEVESQRFRTWNRAELPRIIENTRQAGVEASGSNIMAPETDCFGEPPVKLPEVATAIEADIVELGHVPALIDLRDSVLTWRERWPDVPRDYLFDKIMAEIEGAIETAADVAKSVDAKRLS